MNYCCLICGKHKTDDWCRSERLVLAIIPPWPLDNYASILWFPGMECSQNEKSIHRQIIPFNTFNRLGIPGKHS